MSLPGTINIQDDNFFCLENLILDPDLLYLYSLKDTDGLSEKSISLNTSEASQTTPLESYNSTINFEKDVYTKIRGESNEIIENKAFNMVKGLRNSMTEFHVRSSVQLASTLSEKIYNPFGLTAGSLFLIPFFNFLMQSSFFTNLLKILINIKIFCLRMWVSNVFLLFDAILKLDLIFNFSNF